MASLELEIVAILHTNFDFFATKVDS
jgi:hypothetical protein